MQWISCFLMGGLGNQLFQIFAVIAYAKRHKCNFVFKYSKELRTGILRYTFWDSFLKELLQYTTYESNNSLIAPYIDNFPRFNECGFHYKPLPYKENVDYLSLFGYFQSYKYFVDYWDDIKTMIKLQSTQQTIYNNNKTLLDDKYTISMHFRLGDYKDKQQFHPIMKETYYISALNTIVNKLENSNKNIQVLYFCEQEDINTVNLMIQTIQFAHKKLDFIRVNDELCDWQQMILMSCCNSNIIANSSFSWWGAFMNENNEKIVCYPSTWFGKKFGNNSMNDLFPPSWQKINC
jgi:hypothetical protein